MKNEQNEVKSIPMPPLTQKRLQEMEAYMIQLEEEHRAKMAALSSQMGDFVETVVDALGMDIGAFNYLTGGEHSKDYSQIIIEPKSKK